MDRKVEVVSKPEEVKDEIEMWDCPDCPESFLKRTDFVVHMNDKHPDAVAAESVKAEVEDLKLSSKKEPVHDELEKAVEGPVKDDPPGEDLKEVSFKDLPDDAVLTVAVPLLKKELLWLREMPGFLDEVEAIRAGMRLLAVHERD